MDRRLDVAGLEVGGQGKQGSLGASDAKFVFVHHESYPAPAQRKTRKSNSNWAYAADRHTDVLWTAGSLTRTESERWLEPRVEAADVWGPATVEVAGP